MVDSTFRSLGGDGEMSSRTDGRLASQPNRNTKQKHCTTPGVVVLYSGNIMARGAAEPSSTPVRSASPDSEEVDSTFDSLDGG